MPKGDLVLTSTSADVKFISTGIGEVLFWFDTPKKGKCLSVESNNLNDPSVFVTVQANWRARRQIARYRRGLYRDADWDEWAEL